MQIIKFILTIITVLLPFVANAWDIKVDNICYNINGSEATVVSTDDDNNKYKGNIVIPQKVHYNKKDYKVVGIGSEAFRNCYIESVSIPQGLQFIEDRAFLECIKIKEIEIPSSVEKIEYAAFALCSNLTKVTIHSNSVLSQVFNIDAKTNNELGGLIDIFGNQVETYILGSGITNISNYAFRNCIHLSSITFPNTLTSIGDYAFENCPIRSLSFPSSLTSIGIKAFEGNERLTSLVIPENVEYVGVGAFDSESLTSITINSNKFVSADHSVSSPSGGTYRSFVNIFGNHVEEYKLGNKITSIGTSAFSGCSAMKKISLSKNIVLIGTAAFRGCNGLTSIDLSTYKIKTIRNQAFSDCKNLTSIILPQVLDSIGTTIFSGCISLTSISIPENLIEIPDAAFRGCSGLKSIVIPNNILKIGESVFKECSSLTDIELPEDLDTIPKYCFKGCTSLSTITIPESVKYVGNVAFGDCTVLKDIYCLPTSRPNAEYYTFDDATKKNAVLHVPAKSINSYKKTSPWSLFKNIEGIGEALYTITYVVDGEIYKTYELEVGTEIQPEQEPTKEGYTFSGWSEIPETMPDCDITITGSFSINTYLLSYVVDEVKYKSFEIKYGSPISPIDDPVKEGYTFSGWSEIPETMPAKDITITGSFKINTYKLIYEVDGVEYKSYDVEYGATITAEPEPTKEGYTFSGWSEIPETMPAHDVTVYATFTTGITCIDTDKKTKLTIYSLEGRIIKQDSGSLEELPKGIYIIGGKKFVK